MGFLNHWLLTILLLIPLCGTAAVALLRRRQTLIRRVALGTTVTACAVSLLILAPFRWRQATSYDEGEQGSVKLAEKAPLASGAEYHVGVDGLSFPFLVFTTLMFAMICLTSWNDLSGGAGYYATLLFLEFASIGTYISFDFLILIGFLALSIAATYALIRSIGEPRAARGMLIYLSLGLICVAAPILAMRSTGKTFDLIKLAGSAMDSSSARRAAFSAVVFGFIIRMAAIPFHSWVVTALSKTPGPIAIMIAAVIPISGVYGLMRIAMPLFPQAADGLWGAFAVLGVAGFMYGALCAMACDDLREFVAYSMISMMGCVLMAVMLRTAGAIDGAVLLVIGQGMAAAMMLLLTGHANGGMEGGCAGQWTAFFGVVSVAWLTVPVMFGQLIVVLASFETARFGAALRVGSIALPGPGYGLAVAASFGLLANGAAAARMIRKVFLRGDAASEGQSGDLTVADVTALSILGIVAVLVGVVPDVLVFTFTHPAARAIFHSL